MMVRIAADPIVLASLVLQAPHVAKRQAVRGSGQRLI